MNYLQVEGNVELALYSEFIMNILTCEFMPDSGGPGSARK